MTIDALAKRRLTEAFIAADPTEITEVERRSSVPTSTGGRTSSWATVAGPWTVRITPQGGIGAGYSLTEDGNMIRVVAGLVAMPDAGFLKHDRFVVDGRNYEINSVQYEGEGYRLAAELIYVGEEVPWEPIPAD